MKKPASELKIGDVIMPPAREVQLWMKRECRTKGLPESALYLTVTNVEQSASDARGPWLLVSADETPEWVGNRTAYPFRFKVRPETPWATIRSVEQ